MKDNKLENPKPIRKIPNRKSAPKPPKPNIMWFYAIIVVVLLVVATLLNTTTTNTIPFKRFSENMLKQHDVAKVVCYRNGDLVVAEVYIKPDAINKPEYKDAKKEQRLNMGPSDGPQYTFTDATYEGIKQQIF